MSTSDQPPSPAWEPLTPRGVAAFARASLGRLLLVQVLVALMAAALGVWFLHGSWFPVVSAAIRRLPADSEIRDQRLQWEGENPMLLAGNHFLGLAVDLNHSSELGHEAGLNVEFGREDVRLVSFLGYRVVAYPPGWRGAFNRTELEPWWGAWAPGLLAGAAVVTVAGLLAAWAVLASVYCLPLWLITFFRNRDLSLGQSWRMSGAALMPGALFMNFALLSYALEWVDLPLLASLAGLHVVIGWLYLVIGPFFLPRNAAPGGAGGNPFHK